MLLVELTNLRKNTTFNGVGATFVSALYL